jgi:putative acetyltransferase
MRLFTLITYDSLINMQEEFKLSKTTRKVEDVHELLIQSEAYANSLYPPEGVFMLSLDEMDQPNVHLFVARNREHQAIGCGAIVVNENETGEIKRMFIQKTARGKGLGKRILETLETIAKENNVKLMQLETGPLQLAAIKMYEQCGYTHRGPFGDYLENEMSVFMEKQLNE